MGIKILLVEDHTIIRSGLRALLEQHPDLEVVGEASGGQQAVEMVSDLGADIVLMDVMLRGSQVTGIQATQQITASNPDTKVIALSVVEDLTYVKRMLAAGARAYLFKGCTKDELIQAIDAVMKGKTYFSEDALRIVQEDYVSTVQNQEESRKRKLSARESEILRRITSGHPSKSIAADLKISRKTVDAHKRKIMHKLNIWSIAELTQYALREGMIMNND